MNIRRYIYLFVTAAVMTAAVTSCDKENDDDIFLAGGGSSTIGGGGNEDPDEPIIEPDINPTVIAGKIEVPAMKDGNLFISHSTTQNGKEVMTYCLEFDTQAYHSRWVAFRFDATTRTQNTGRTQGDPFQDDPSLPSQYWIGDGVFGSGYDRGHLCASADRVYSSAANRQTFYMTNMSPQMSRFNQDYWVGFEGKVQDWGRSKSFSDTLYVVKGGTVNPDQIKGTISRNGHKVVIPKYYFMAILKVKNGAYSAIAFWMEHKDYKMSNISNSEIASKVVTIDKLEELTGIDFFPNLPDAVEAKVEATVSTSAWGL